MQHFPQVQLLKLVYMHMFIMETTESILPQCVDIWPQERLCRLNTSFMIFVIHYLEKVG